LRIRRLVIPSLCWALTGLGGFSLLVAILFFMGPTINISRSKRVYLAESPPSSTACSSPPSGTTPPASCSVYL